MPLLASVLSKAITIWVTASIVGLVARVLVGFGVAVITIQGFDLLTTEFENFVQSSISGISADVLQILYIAGFDVATNILISSYTAMVTLNAITGGFKKLAFVGP